MCLIGAAIDVPGPWLLVIAANRDEFHDRPTAPATYWDDRAPGGAKSREDEPHRSRRDDAILAGRDLRSGGTWLGMRHSASGASLRIAALTNLRPGLMPQSAAGAQSASSSSGPTVRSANSTPSRGQLVTDFLAAASDPHTFLRGLEPAADAYAGFNLIALTVQTNAQPESPVDAWYLNNLPDTAGQRLGSGLHLVSNATLDVPWSKVVRLRATLHAALEGTSDPMTLQARLFAALDDRIPATDEELPHTGLEQARERLMSAPFIVDETYGTRCSTVIIVRRDGDGLFCERSFDRHGRLVVSVTEHLRLGARDRPLMLAASPADR